MTNLILRTDTVGGEMAKQIFIFAQNPAKKAEDALIIKKLVLVSDKARQEMYEKTDSSFIMVKEFKGVKLFKQVFAIKATSLNLVLHWLDKELNETSKQP